MGCGISKAGAVQPSFSRVAATSAAPSAAPCTPCVPALFGAPKPIWVLQAISTGLSEFCALLSAAAISCGLWPSMCQASQPAALKRATWSVESARFTAPSMVMLLLSQSTTSLDELQMPGERDRLLAHAFHQTAVAGDDVSAVIDEIAIARGEKLLGDRHADSHGEALPERPGGRLDAGRVAIFGMARRLGAELTEALDLLDRHLRIAGEIEQRIEQHRAMAGREHEAVAVRPSRIGRVEFQKLREENRRHIGHAHRHAGMAGIGLLHRIDSQEADRIGELAVRDAGASALASTFIEFSFTARAGRVRRVAE